MRHPVQRLFRRLASQRLFSLQQVPAAIRLRYVFPSQRQRQQIHVVRACHRTTNHYQRLQRNGIQADHEEAGYFFFHKYKISGSGRAAMWFPCEHYYDKYNYTENKKYAPQNVILNRCEIVDNAYGAMWRRVGGAYVINCKFDNKKLDMALFKCGVTMENSEFLKGIGEYDDIDNWPQGVNTLW